jgi:hypothetical protein
MPDRHRTIKGRRVAYPAKVAAPPLKAGVGETREERMRDPCEYWCIGKEYWWGEVRVTKEEYLASGRKPCD